MNITDPVVLVVEGVDCVGKTTLSKAIAEKHGFHYLYTPQPPLSMIRKELEQMNDLNTRFFYYLASVIAVQPLILADLKLGRSIVIDRYIYSTFIMHQMLGANTRCVDMKNLPILWPTMSVLLTARTEIRSARKSSRGEVQEYDRRIEQSCLLLDNAQEMYQSAYNWSLVLDTDNLTSQEVEQKVVALLREK